MSKSTIVSDANNTTSGTPPMMIMNDDDDAQDTVVNYHGEARDRNLR